MSREKIDGVTVIPRPTEEFLNSKQRTDYRQHRIKLIKWALNIGKNPKKAKGYANETVKQRGYRLDKFYRWVWRQEGRYTTDIQIKHADEYIKELAYSDEESTTYKAGMQKSIKMLFKWRNHEHGTDIQWEPELNFSSSQSASNPKDYFTKKERKRLRETALEYGSIPTYDNLSKEQRRKWKAHISQILRKPIEEVTKKDWDKINSWKITSLVWTTLDTGLRCTEVEHAKTSWIDTDNEVLRIPKEDSAKNEDNWIVSIHSKTAEALQNWLQQRKTINKYDDTNIVWLTREGNPYNRYSLNYLIKKLCKKAEIDTQNRKATWYSIRHSVGTYMTREEGLAAAQSQLRHKSQKITMKYDQAPIEDRRKALDKMG